MKFTSNFTIHKAHKNIWDYTSVPFYDCLLILSLRRPSDSVSTSNINFLFKWGRFFRKFIGSFHQNFTGETQMCVHHKILFHIMRAHKKAEKSSGLEAEPWKKQMWKHSRARKRETEIVNRVSLEGVFVFVISFHCLFVAHFYRRSSLAGIEAQAYDKFNLLLKRFPFFTFSNILLCRLNLERNNGITTSWKPSEFDFNFVRALLSFQFTFGLDSFSVLCSLQAFSILIES